MKGTSTRASVLYQSYSRLVHNKVTTMSGQRITFKSSNKAGDGHGVIFGDPAITPKALIFIHEWWGLNEQIQKSAEAFAQRANLTVFVPDIYRGKVADDRETAGHYMQGLDFEGAVLDVQGAARYLLDSGCSKVGVTGFCLGGALAFLGALKVPEISAAAPFYGIPSKAKDSLVDIKIPMQGHFGKLDTLEGFSSPKDYLSLNAKLVEAGVDFTLYEYDAAHAFTNSAGLNFDKDATELAMERMTKFMHDKLA